MTHLRINLKTISVNLGPGVSVRFKQDGPQRQTLYVICYASNSECFRDSDL